MLPDAPRITWGARLKRALLGADSAVDSGLWSLTRAAGDAYARFQMFMDRFHLTGAKKASVDLACEALTMGAAGGVVMIALAAPAFREAPEELMKRQELAVTFLDRYGNEVGKRGIKHDDSIPLDEFPDHFIKAALATEDRRFYEHWGIDPVGTARALSANSRAGGVVQGGSSITQQLAKNLFLSNERSLERKIKEAFLALWLETRLSKDQILKLYLDRAYMGGGAFGAAAAAEFYFGKSVKDLNLAESAMMAGLFKAPARFAPHINLPAARARASTVLSNMVEAGFLTEGQVLAARRNPAAPVDRKRDATPDYYLDWAFDQIKKMAEAGKLGSDRVLTVKTPLDRGLQQKAEQALENSLRQYGDQYNVGQGAIVVMDLDGAVRAVVGGRDYGASQFNRATDALRQPGSSFKPFVYATAMSDPLTAAKYKPDSIVRDAPVCIGNWCPRNYSGGFAGAIPLTVALAKSYNTIPVWMSLDLSPRDEKGERTYRMGRAKIIATLKAMGFTTDIKDTPSLPIGAVDVTVMDMTSGYATIANGGKLTRPYAAIEIHNSAGELIWRQDRDAAPPKQILSPQVDSDLVYMMSKVVEEGTGRRAILPGIKAAGKTGTTNAYRDAWFIAFTGNYVGGVWMGNDDYASMATMTGGTVPAMTWHEVMAYAHQGLDIKPIPLLTRDPAPPPVPVAARAPKTDAKAETLAQRPATLSRKSLDALGALEQQFKSAGASRPSARAPMLREVAAAPQDTPQILSP
ncbi:PBP1A family penicillin-binding protein [Terrarubrum flagellatum]|uniref:transglycosylase domain-containing protein n=1 Tax=Terrirubrum flagellatum TaxID=2895980 RepID=UPI003144E174